MRKSWLLCVLLGTLAWGQAQPGMTPAQPSPAQAPSPAAKAPEPPAAEVPENAVVLTIKGVCPATPKTTMASKTGAGKTAPAKGLDKSARFMETMRIYRMQILTTELKHTVQEEADKIPPEKIAEYYKSNPEAYEQFSLDRLFIPRYKQAEAEDKEDAKEPEKLTEEQQKAKEAADKAKQEKGEQELNKLADSLRERAAAGEDFAKLQKEAFEAAGVKVDNPTVNL